MDDHMPPSSPTSDTSSHNNGNNANEEMMESQVMMADPMNMEFISSSEKQLIAREGDDTDDRLCCPECPDTHFSDLSKLCDHINCDENHGDSKCAWICTYCSAIFFDCDTFKTHLIWAHRIQKDMLETFDVKNNPLLNPTLISPDEELLECPECGLAFADENSIRLHRVRRHSITNLDITPVSCTICEEIIPIQGETNYRETLTHHMNFKHSLSGIACVYCGKLLSKLCTLNRHIEQVHLNLQIHKPAKCPECQKVFSKKGHLDRHIRSIHMGVKHSSEPCPFCGKTFSSKSSLEPHISMVHNGVKRKCTVCGKILSDIWKHMRAVHGQYRRDLKGDAIPPIDNGGSEFSESTHEDGSFFDLQTDLSTVSSSPDMLGNPHTATYPISPPWSLGGHNDADAPHFDSTMSRSSPNTDIVEDSNNALLPPELRTLTPTFNPNLLIVNPHELKKALEQQFLSSIPNNLRSLIQSAMRCPPIHISQTGVHSRLKLRKTLKATTTKTGESIKIPSFQVFKIKRQDC